MHFTEQNATGAHKTTEKIQFHSSGNRDITQYAANRAFFSKIVYYSYFSYQSHEESIAQFTHAGLKNHDNKNSF